MDSTYEPMPVENVLKLAAFIPRGSAKMMRRKSPLAHGPMNSFALWSLSQAKSAIRPSALTMFVTPSSFLPPSRCKQWRVQRLRRSCTYSQRPQATARKVTSPMPKRLWLLMVQCSLFLLAYTEWYSQGLSKPHWSYAGTKQSSRTLAGTGVIDWWTNQQGRRGDGKFFFRVTNHTFSTPYSTHVRMFSTAKAPFPRMAAMLPSR
mmetsp:Transcript_28678/g.89167  ORF Transcript_28678/g.89167 Transcript_28678/m.89167 type:complete len:205 (+) Transcript_28678:610-1224(+)